VVYRWPNPVLKKTERERKGGKGKKEKRGRKGKKRRRRGGRKRWGEREEEKRGPVQVALHLAGSTGR